MTIQTFIERAIEGGWEPLLAHEVHFANWNNRSASHKEVRASYVLHEILLDPLAWKAVGKVEGWNNVHENGQECYHGDCSCHDSGCTWRQWMHGMIDALAEGKTIEQYLETL